MERALGNPGAGQGETCEQCGGHMRVLTHDERSVAGRRDFPESRPVCVNRSCPSNGGEASNNG
jgi:hypothetical protein